MCSADFLEIYRYRASESEIFCSKRISRYMTYFRLSNSIFSTSKMSNEHIHFSIQAEAKLIRIAHIQGTTPDGILYSVSLFPLRA